MTAASAPREPVFRRTADGRGVQRRLAVVAKVLRLDELLTESSLTRRPRAEAGKDAGA